MVGCVFSLESPRGGYSNEVIHHPFMLEKEIKDIPVVPLDLFDDRPLAAERSLARAAPVLSICYWHLVGHIC